MKNLNPLTLREKKEINGGSICPTYDIKDNYDAAADQGETMGTYLYGFVCGFFTALFS